MKLLDSNIVIYSYQPAYSFLKPLVIDPTNAVSAISRLEILGFHGLQPGEQTYCEAELNTRNVSDFKSIPGLMLVNPVP